MKHNVITHSLFGANLHGADLFGANLPRADLFGADLRSANLNCLRALWRHVKAGHMVSLYPDPDVDDWGRPR